MQPRPIFMYRRRWTLLFQVPFTLLMLACLAYSVLLIYAADNKLLTLIGSAGAFGSFCIAGTLGRSAWEAYREREPALVIDESGITDLRDDDSQTVPWEAMERVLLDISENIIRVKLRTSSTESALGVIVKTLQRWQRGGDVVFLLGGLAYDARQVQMALRAHHAAAVPRRSALQ